MKSEFFLTNFLCLKNVPFKTICVRVRRTRVIEREKKDGRPVIGYRSVVYKKCISYYKLLRNTLLLYQIHHVGNP